MFKFNLRDLLWGMVVVAFIICWRLEYMKRQQSERREQAARARYEYAKSICVRHHYEFYDGGDEESLPLVMRRQ